MLAVIHMYQISRWNLGCAIWTKLAKYKTHEKSWLNVSTMLERLNNI